MADEKKKPTLTQVGKNSYTSGGPKLSPQEEGGNRFKKALGLKTAPWEALVSQEAVDVIGREDFGENEPNQGYPVGKMAEIYLGTPTKKPTGTWLPPEGRGPDVDPLLKPLWEKVKAKHPYAGRFVSGIRPFSLGEMELGKFGEFDNKAGEIMVDSTTDENTLLHELGHAAQYAAFPKEDDFWTHHRGQGTHYRNQRGEITSRMLAQEEAPPFHGDDKSVDLKELRARKEALIRALMPGVNVAVR